MPPTYRIKDWNERWENAATRKLSRCPDYLPIRTDQRSSVFLRLMQSRDGIAAYGVFVALVQLAASCQPQRGTLARSGVAYDADTCAGLIGADRKTFRRAWNRLVAEGWLTRSDALDATDAAALDATDAAGTVADFRQQVSHEHADDGGNGGGNPPPNPTTRPTVSANASHGFSSRARNGTVRHGTDTATARDGQEKSAAAAAGVSTAGEPLSDVRRALLALGLTPGGRLDAIEASALTPADVRAVGDQWRAAKGKGTGVLLGMLEARATLVADTARRAEAARRGREWCGSADVDAVRERMREYLESRGMRATPETARQAANSDAFAVWVGERLIEVTP